MSTNKAKETLSISLSFLLALVLDILPLPTWAIWFRPEWLVLVTIYWVMMVPNRVSIGVAWCLGLLLDAMNGTLLGEHAFAMALVAYLVVKFHRRIRVFPIWQQAVTIFTLVLCYQASIFFMQGLNGELPMSLWYWIPSITSMLLWPWIYVMLQDCHSRA